MADENLFEEPTGDSGQPTGTPSLPDSVKELVGEGKKYATVEKALEALVHSQVHIQKIEQENAQLRDSSAKVIDQETLLETVQELLKKERATHGSATLDEASIDALLDRKLTTRDSQKQETANAQTVKDALVKKYGSKEKAQEIFNARSSELGVDLTKMAKTAPRAALELLGVKSDSVPTTPASRGTVNSEALKHDSSGVQPQRKSVMGGSTTKELMDAWAAARPKDL